MDTAKDQNKLLNSIRDFWPIILFLVSLIILGVRFEGRLNAVEQRLSMVETKAEQNSVFNNDVRAQLAEIKVTLQFIKQALTDKP